MSTPEIPRSELLEAVIRATAEVSAGRALFSQGVAERFGLAAIDISCLQLLAADGAMAVGRLGELTALTTGATTRMVDRLEQAGYVRRVPDPADRRRVNVEPVIERTAAIAGAFEPIDAVARRSLEAASDADLDAIHAYLVASLGAIREQTARLRDATPSGGRCDVDGRAGRSGHPGAASSS